MTDNLKTAFDDICAGDTLKSGTVIFLQREMQRRSETQNRLVFKGLTAAFACIALILLSVMFSYNLYFTPSAYVDVDINPSVELAVNRVDRIIGVHAYNSDGENILSKIDLKHKNYEDALIILLGAVNQEGYIQDNGLVTVTLQTGNRENEMLANIQTGVTGFIHRHHGETQIDVFLVGNDTRSHAHEQGISPAKYLAIQDLIEVDPTASVEDCKDHSISEIRQLTQEHTGNHHEDGDCDTHEGDIQDDTGHHGGGH